MVMHFRTDPFDAVCTSLFFSNTAVLHVRGKIIWICVITVGIVATSFRGLSFLGLYGIGAFEK